MNRLTAAGFSSFYRNELILHHVFVRQKLTDVNKLSLHMNMKLCSFQLLQQILLLLKPIKNTTTVSACHFSTCLFSV